MTTITLQLGDELSQQIECVANDRKVNLSTCIMPLLELVTEPKAVERDGGDELLDDDDDDDDLDSPEAFLSIEGDSSYVLRISGELYHRLQARSDELEIFFTEEIPKPEAGY